MLGDWNPGFSYSVGPPKLPWKILIRLRTKRGPISTREASSSIIWKWMDGQIVAWKKPITITNSGKCIFSLQMNQSLVSSGVVKHYLVISEPYPVVCNSECEDMVHKRLTLRVVPWSGKRLGQKEAMSTCMFFFLKDVQRAQLSEFMFASSDMQLVYRPGWRAPSVEHTEDPYQISVGENN